MSSLIFLLKKPPKYKNLLNISYSVKNTNTIQNSGLKIHKNKEVAQLLITHKKILRIEEEIIRTEQENKQK